MGTRTSAIPPRSEKFLFSPNHARNVASGLGMLADTIPSSGQLIQTTVDNMAAAVHPEARSVFYIADHFGHLHVHTVNTIEDERENKRVLEESHVHNIAPDGPMKQAIENGFIYIPDIFDPKGPCYRLILSGYEPLCEPVDNKINPDIVENYRQRYKLSGRMDMAFGNIEIADTFDEMGNIIHQGQIFGVVKVDTFTHGAPMLPDEMHPAMLLSPLAMIAKIAALNLHRIVSESKFEDALRKAHEQLNRLKELLRQMKHDVSGSLTVPSLCLQNGEALIKKAQELAEQAKIRYAELKSLEQSVKDKLRKAPASKKHAIKNHFEKTRQAREQAINEQYEKARNLTEKALAFIERAKKLIMGLSPYLERYTDQVKRGVFELPIIFKTVKLGEIFSKYAGLDRLNVKLHADKELLEETIITDMSRVVEIIDGLLENARKHSNEGKITPAKNVINITVKKVDQKLHISVSDRGTGIAPENLERIFEEGFQVKKKPSSEIGSALEIEGRPGAERRIGGGFGLPGFRKTAQKLDGTLRAESEGLGKGSTFILELPLKMQPPDS